MENQLLTILHGEVQIFSTRLNFCLGVACVVGESFSPTVLLEDFVHQEDGTSCDEGIFVLQHTILEQHGLD